MSVLTYLEISLRIWEGMQGGARRSDSCQWTVVGREGVQETSLGQTEKGKRHGLLDDDDGDTLPQQSVCTH